MSHAPAHLQPVDAGGLPDYPISAQDRLDAHFFVLWNVKRWRGSDFRRHGYADPEVGFFGLELFFLCQDETPVGTLPCDDAALAFLLRIPVSRWLNLKSRDVSPLHNWTQFQCDNGQVRLGHPVIIEVVREALDAKRKNAAKNDDDRMRKRLGTIAMHLRDGLKASALASQEDTLNAISDWISARYPGGSATFKRVREAVNELHSRR